MTMVIDTLWQAREIQRLELERDEARAALRTVEQERDEARKEAERLTELAKHWCDSYRLAELLMNQRGDERDQARSALATLMQSELLKDAVVEAAKEKRMTERAYAEAFKRCAGCGEQDIGPCPLHGALFERMLMADAAHDDAIDALLAKEQV